MAPDRELDLSPVDRAFAQAIADARAERGRTRRSVAEDMARRGFDFHVSTVGKIERCERRVTVGEATALSSILGIRSHEYTDPMWQEPRMAVDQAAGRFVYAIDHISESFRELSDYRDQLREAARRFDEGGQPYDTDLGRTAAEVYQGLLTLPLELNIPHVDILDDLRDVYDRTRLPSEL